MEWISVYEHQPEEGQQVWYYFKVFDKVYDGEFYMSDGMRCFGGKRGWLCEDVTWWMPRNEGDIPPKPPEDSK